MTSLETSQPKNIQIGRTTMRRKIFEPEHDDFRATARSFFLTECVPHSDE